MPQLAAPPASAVDAPTVEARDVDPLDAEALGTELRVALTRISRRLRGQRGEADLTEGMFGVLVTLDRHGAMSPGALAERERVRPPSMTRAVSMLAEQGLVTKTADPDDGRCVIVGLTEAGRAEVVETRRRRDAWLTRRLAELAPEERAVLAHATDLIARISAT